MQIGKSTPDAGGGRFGAYGDIREEPSPVDEVILRAYADGNPSGAWDALVHNKYDDLIIATVHRRLRRYRFWSHLADDEEDIVQSAREVVHRSLCSDQTVHRSLAARVTWLTELVVKGAARRYRAKLDYVTYTPLPPGEEDALPEYENEDLPIFRRPVSPHHAAEHRQRLLHFDDCLNKLKINKPKWAELVRLRLLGFSLKELVEELGYSDARNGGKALGKAIVILRACLEKWGWM